MMPAQLRIMKSCPLRRHVAATKETISPPNLDAQIRNAKLEIRNKSEIRNGGMTKTSARRRLPESLCGNGFRAFENSCFEFVSDFGFRVSCLRNPDQECVRGTYMLRTYGLSPKWGSTKGQGSRLWREYDTKAYDEIAMAWIVRHSISTVPVAKAIRKRSSSEDAGTTRARSERIVDRRPRVVIFA